MIYIIFKAVSIIPITSKIKMSYIYFPNQAEFGYIIITLTILFNIYYYYYNVYLIIEDTITRLKKEKYLLKTYIEKIENENKNLNEKNEDLNKQFENLQNKFLNIDVAQSKIKDYDEKINEYGLYLCMR